MQWVNVIEVMVIVMQIWAFNKMILEN
jgi:hypothetical protein